MTQPRPIIGDPAFAAVARFDAQVREWDEAFGRYLKLMDTLDPKGAFCWDDPAAVIRAVLGPTDPPAALQPFTGSFVAATLDVLDGLLRRLGELDDRLFEAEARLLSTRAASEIGAAALRAAVRRYARRPFGCRSDEAVLLGALAA